MCGIHFILSNNQEQTNLIDKMVSGSTHRGPDNQNSYKNRIEDTHFALGHNLLAITGDKNDTQPLSNSQYAFAINGEIYNYLALANKYNIANRKTDSIVAYELLKTYGIDIVQEFNGMFAFVFIDIKNKKTYLVRDFFGQKPLYYSKNNSSFIASSENQSILSSGLITQDLNTSEVRNILTQKHIGTGSSIYKNIHQVASGEIITISDNCTIAKSRFKPPVSNDSTDLKLSLENSINNHCLGTENPAVFYSGGLDSSILLHELKHSGRNPVAYTIDTNNTSAFATSDTSFATAFTKSLSIEHQVIKPIATDFDEFINSIDVPIGDGAFYFNWLLSKEVSKTQKIALTGNGADELFGGYNRHIAYQKFISNKSLFLVLSKFKAFLKIFRSSNKSRLLNKFLSSISSNERQTFLNFSKLNLGITNDSITNESFTLEEALKYDLENYLPQDILSLSDQAGMAHSLEVRSPFLESNLWNISNNLNAAGKMKTNGKHHLKSIYQNISCFEPIINRKKEGFGIPFLSFFGEEKLKELASNITALAEFVSKKELYSIQQIIKEEKETYSNEYWTLLILTKWLTR